MDSPGVQELWKAAGDSRLIVNVLCGRNNADAVARMLEKFARPPVVLDHCMNLRAGQDHDTVLADLLRIAKYPNAHAKLTFLATGSAEQYPFRDLHDFCRRLITAYTPGRCVWGSDFPCELWTRKATYSQNLRLFTEELGRRRGQKGHPGRHRAPALFQLRPAARSVHRHGLSRLVSAQVRPPAGVVVIHVRQEDPGIHRLASGPEPEIQILA